MTNVKGSKETTRNVTNLKEVLALNKIVVARYVESRLSDDLFAQSINNNEEERKQFRFPLNASHIKTAREGVDMQSNSARMKSMDSVGDCLGLVARVQALEEQLGKLTAYIKSKGV